MPRHGLLIFDLDGTLFQAHTVSIPAVQEVFAAFGLAAPPAEEILPFFGRPGTAWHPWLRSQCPPEQADALVAAVDRRELELIAERGRLYPGARAALAALREMAAQLAICSNGPRAYVEQVLQSQDIAALFDVVRYRRPEDTGKPQMVADLLARSSARPALVIGDRWDDIAAARANGLRAIGAGYGYGPLEELQGAAALAHEIGELVGVVGEMLKRRGRSAGPHAPRGATNPTPRTPPRLEPAPASGECRAGVVQEDDGEGGSGCPLSHRGIFPVTGH